jgi:hypothetical protein
MSRIHVAVVDHSMRSAVFMFSSRAVRVQMLAVLEPRNEHPH